VWLPEKRSVDSTAMIASMIIAGNQNVRKLRIVSLGKRSLCYSTR
jgi:hypothetical protein